MVFTSISGIPALLAASTAGTMPTESAGITTSASVPLAMDCSIREICSSLLSAVAGANDTFAKYPDVNVVASQTASWNRTEAYNVTLNLLEANPGVAAIFAANDEMAMGALEAVSQAGKSGQILITGLDANEDAKAAVDAGTLAITCDKNGIGQGYEGVMKAVMLLNGETLEPNYVVDTYLYTKD